MAKISKNLGLVSAIHVGTTAPSNIAMIWYNLTDGLHYYYNLTSTSWVLLSQASVTGSLTNTLIPRASGVDTLEDSQIRDNGVTVSINGAATSTKALLELLSTTKGILIPRLTTVQINAITVGVTENSLLVFDITISKFKFYDHSSTSWKIIESSTIGGETLASILLNGNTTGASDIIISDGQVIEAASGGGQLNLRVGADNTVELTTDGGVYAEAWLYFNNTTAWIGFGNASELLLNANDSHLIVSGTTSGIFKNTSIRNTAVNPQFPSSLSSQESIINANVINTVLLGGKGILAKTDNTAYVNKLGLASDFAFAPIGGPYEVIIEAVALSSDRSLLAPDASGTIALVSNLNDYLPLTGGTMIGSIEMGSNFLSSVGGAGLLMVSQAGLLSIADGSGKEMRFDFSGLTALRVQTIQDKAGTIAHLDDIPHSYQFAASNETTALAAGGALPVYTDYIAVPITVNSVMINVNTAPTGAAIIVDIKKNGTSIFSTLISIDATENTSLTAATPYVLNGNISFVQGDKIECFINQVGSGITGAGLKVKLIQ